MKFKKTDRDVVIACYVFCTIAAIILADWLLDMLPLFFFAFWSFFKPLWAVIVGMAIAYICHPMVRFAENIILPRLKKRNRRFARVLAIALTSIFVALVITVLVFMIVPQIANNFDAISERFVGYVNIIIDNIDAWIIERDWFENFKGLRNLLHLEDVSAALGDFLSTLVPEISQLSLQLMETVANALIGAFLSLHFLYHKELILATVKKICVAILPRRIYRALAEILSCADRAFGQFIVGKLFDSLIVGLLSLIIFSLVGMPYSPLISAIICITTIIPAFGYVIGAVPCFIIIWFENPAMSLLFLLILFIIQQIDGNLIGPKIVGSATGLPAVFVITAIMLMGAYIGPFGWFIGVPLFAVIYRVVGDVANRILKKKGLPTALSHYEDTILREIYIDVFNAAPEGTKEVNHEEMAQ